MISLKSLHNLLSTLPSHSPIMFTFTNSSTDYQSPSVWGYSGGSQLKTGHADIASNFYGGSHKVWKTSKTETDYVFEIVTPGLSKEDIVVSFKDNKLQIEGEQKTYTWLNNVKFDFNLPTDADRENTTAELTNGILKIKIGIAKQSQTDIKIKIS